MKIQFEESQKRLDEVRYKLGFIAFINRLQHSVAKENSNEFAIAEQLRMYFLELDRFFEEVASVYKCAEILMREADYPKEVKTDAKI